MRTGILCAHGTFVVAEGGGGGVVNANRAEMKSWETFRICNLGGTPFADNATISNDAIITLKTINGQFLHPRWGNDVVANAPIAAVAGFNLRVLSGTVSAGQTPVIALRSPVKLPKFGSFTPEYFWVTAEINNPRPVVANRQMASPNAWERFTLRISLGTQSL